MNIFQNFILDTEIIGISNLDKNYYSDSSSYYSFKVFTKNNSIRISSGVLTHESPHEKTWISKYAVIRNRIMQQINELDISDIKAPHIDKVGDAYETLKDQLNLLLADLTPAAHCQEPINARISQIYESIRSLRDLACSPVL